MRIPKITSSVFYHVYNRGVSKQKIFRQKSDYRFFMNRITKFQKTYPVNIVCYCLMPNHYHFLLYTVKKPKNISNFMKSLQQSFALYYNKKYNHSGHVFEGAYKNKIITNPNHLTTTIKYIEQNPVRKELVKTATEWEFAGMSTDYIFSNCTEYKKTNYDKKSKG